jgi:kynurenine formamidase
MRGIVLGIALAALGCDGAASDHHVDSPETPTKALRCPAPRFQVIDLTHTMHEGMPAWPGAAPFKMTRTSDYPQGFRAHVFEMSENVGTHLDAPAHMVEGKRSISQIPADELVVPAVVIDVADKTTKSPDYLVSVGDVSDFEAANGQIAPGAFVIAHTGWHRRFRDPAKYLNQDAEGVMHFPGFSADAAQLLVERDVMGIGIDTPSLDNGPSKDFPTHKIMLGADKYMVENLANLDRLPEVGATVIIGVMLVADGTQAQARVLALVPEKEEPEEDEGQEKRAK